MSLVLALGLLAALGGRPAGGQTLSPGDLSAPHADLDTAEQCGKCHSTGRDVDPDRCLACHEVTRKAHAARRGFHYQLSERSGKGCVGCHAEHHGRDFRLVRFETQVPDFQHRQTGFPLEGKHDGLDCAKCHKGALRYQGLSPRCVSCHDDRHGAQLGTDCARCHDVKAFRPPTGFDHVRTAFPLDGKHRDLACAKCHPARGKDDRTWTGIAHGRCSDCHKDPHGGTMPRACAECHTTDGWKVAAATTLQPWEHAAGRFPLEGGHRGLECAGCHGAKMDRGVDPACGSCHKDPHAGRFGASCDRCHAIAGWQAIADEAAKDHAPGRFPLTGRHRTVGCAACHGQKMEKKVEARCAACHDDPHGARFGAECKDCHGTERWHVPSGGKFSHDRTEFPLLGRHSAVACDKCHPASARTYAARYAERPHTRCRDCHADPHGRTFESVEGGAECEACHSVEGFVPSSYGRDAHARAAFPLAGAHQAVPCDTCHRPKAKAPVVLTLPRRACADCHEDVHHGAFAARSGPRGCATCHGQTSWKSGDFDHSTTRFPLTGRHLGLPCAGCHGNTSGGATVQFAGLDRRCAACHGDAHFGQLAGPPAARECGECHTAEAFRIAAFDHTTSTGWPLEGAHARAACRACHPPVALPGGGETLLYRPTPRACEACHQNPHRTLEGMACATCHTPSDWRRMPEGVAFDHTRTGFPLVGRHSEAACTRCHGTLTRPEGVAMRGCGDCHTDPHRGREGPECARCHTSRSWTLPAEVRDHDRTRFPLVGAHRTADCFACHPGAEPPEYRGTPRDCYACHADDYANPSNHPDHATAGFPVRCEECHGQWSWSGVRLSHTFWPLRGAHATTECFGCHAGGRYAGTPTDCLGCHQDDFAATTEPDHERLGFPTRCAECHSETLWEAASATWHDRFFPLRGDHRGLACADCHPGGSATDVTCTACHEHAADRTNAEHREVRGYVYESRACVNCHPRGDD